ncbi:MAG: hypothetical protein JNG84_11605 [Archangium sp.]|nr:hypothetical protein [Archangium sp.]
MKNPVAIAILNFLTIGLGTALLGKRPLYGWLAFFGGSLLRYEEMRVGTAVDGYREATRG